MGLLKKLSRFKESSVTTKKDFDFLKNQNNYFSSNIGTNVEKLENFSKYVSRQSITYFLARYEIFKKILNVQGSIIECGVLFGGGLISFAQFSAIFEPINHQRKIIGFDTFSGFPNISKKDSSKVSDFSHRGGYGIDSYNDLKKCIKLYDSNRFLNHIPKVDLVKGDATKTIPQYLKKNPQTIISLLYLDFDLYEPTKVALENFVPRMPKGGVIVFDELNDAAFPGETLAVLDTLGIRNLKIQRNFHTYMSYVVLE